MIDFFKDLFTDGAIGIILGSLMIILCLGMLVLIVGLGVIVFDYCSGYDQKITVTVVGKAYSPSKTGIGTGTTFVGGKIGVGTVVVSEDESYNIIVKTDKGEVFSQEVKPAEYAIIREGQRIVITIRIGGISKTRY